MTNQGFIKLYRKIQNHWLYEEKRKFSKFEAWIDMLMMANHKDNKFVLGNELVTVKRGQFITSIRKLGERWNWSNTKVSQFLDLLKSDEMIDYKKDTKKTLITIDNYGSYHDSENEKKTQNEHEKDTKRTQKHTNKNVKNDKNEKNSNIPFAEIVNYLNQKTEKNFRDGTRKTRDLIQARWNEGFREEDFYKVIDVCCSKWKGQTFTNGAKGDDYLQPSTLFNNKFEERLHWTQEKKKRKVARF